MSPKNSPAAGKPRIVDGAREDHMIAGHQQNMEEWGPDKAAMKILAQGLKGDSSTRGEEENFSEADDVVLDGLSHSHCLEYLGRYGASFLTKNLKDKEMICSMFLDMADHVKVLPPADEPLPWDILDMSRWKDSLCELIKEMKTVEEKCPSLIRNSGVYVLTTSPYAAFLRALAAEIADRCS